MILLIDNYDSFTYNLLHYLGEVTAGQVEIKVFRNDELSLAEAEALNPTRLVISPGPGNPNQAGCSLAFLQHFHGRIPILGVCLGHQAIGQLFGGEIVRGLEPVHGKVSQIYHHGESIFAGIENPFQATRYHSLVVRRDTLPNSLMVTAWSADQQIMGLCHRDCPQTAGVQFHPESIMTKVGHALLKNFCAITPSQPA